MSRHNLRLLLVFAVLVTLLYAFIKTPKSCESVSRKTLRTGKQLNILSLTHTDSPAQGASAAVIHESRKRLTKYSTSKNSSMYTSMYLLNNPSICSSVQNLTFIIVVHSATENFNKRLGIRHTWANHAHYKGFNMRTVFFMGRPADTQVQNLIQAENRQYNDIVQGPFSDTYRNITYKGVMVFQWLYEFCANAQMIVKIDDDMFVNMFSIVRRRLPMMLSRPRQMMCDVVKKGRIRRKGEKWSIRDEELPGRKEYPTYCRGYLLLISPDLIEPMLDKVPSTPFFWIDDVYLYGLVPEFLGVTWRAFVPWIPQSLDQCLLEYNSKTRPYLPPDGCLNVPGRRDMVQVWLTVLGHLTQPDKVLLSDHTLKSWTQTQNETATEKD